MVRTGVLGEIGQFQAADYRFRRGTQVICRSARGLELGTVLTPLTYGSSAADNAGAIVRKASVEDQLVWARIEKNRRAAFQECQQLLAQHDVPSALLDVEMLFDGESIFFYFLGKVSPEVELLLRPLAEAYEAKVQLRQFGEAIAAGCGPDCGTDQGGGCHEGGCASCGLAQACGTERP